MLGQTRFFHAILLQLYATTLKEYLYFIYAQQHVKFISVISLRLRHLPF
jgi:hypothetical protein